jgi:hypothetical protein
MPQAEHEARRRARWGESSRRGAAGAGASFGRAGYGAGRRDFLGYYAMLGLDGEHAEQVTESDVKRAFREAALRWHPDRQKVGFCLLAPVAVGMCMLP